MAPISRKGMQDEITRLKAENRRLIEGGRPGAAASLIVSELYKIASKEGMTSGATGEEFIAYWKKVLEERQVMAELNAALLELGPALEAARDHIRSCFGTDERPESDSAEIVRMCDGALEKVKETLK